MKNIHKHEEHTPKKLIQIKSSNTFKIPSKYKSQTYQKYNPKTQVKIHCPPQPFATNIDENQIVYTMDESKVRSCERLLLNQMDLEASIKNRRSPHVNGLGRFS